MAKSLDECMGLLAYYESESMDGKSVKSLSKYRKQVYKDFKNSKIDDDIRYLLWVLMSYPSFLEKIILGKSNAFDRVPKSISNKEDLILDELSEVSSVKINKILDKFVISNTNNKIVKSFLKSQRKGKKFDSEEFFASSDSEEVLLFLMNFEAEYQSRVVASFKNQA